MERPRTYFARAGSVAVAYQVLGDGPVDLVYASGWLTNIDMVWESPRYSWFLRELAKFSRLIMFDKRGSGLSDRDVGFPTLEERADDIRAVMDDVGSETASIFGVSEGGNVTNMFAATYPERCRSIILHGCRPCRAWKPDWPSGLRRGDFEKHIDALVASWGEPFEFEVVSPEMAAHPAESAHWLRLLLHSAGPSSAAALTRLNYEIDIRSVLPAVKAPALVIVRRGESVGHVEGAQYLAEHLPNGRLSVHDGDDHLPWFGDAEATIEEIRRFITEDHSATPDERVLASVLMTDIAGSTEHAARLGDARWRELINAHDRVCVDAITRYDGVLIKTMGDGLLATFSGPSRAIACAVEIRHAAADLGLSVRAGLHAGECLRRDQDISGLAVNLAARIMDLASGGEINVSGTIRDLVVGSGTTFDSAGVHELKGVPGEWPLFRVTD
jgi:class 3 adenylate cyclase